MDQLPHLHPETEALSVAALEVVPRQRLAVVFQCHPAVVLRLPLASTDKELCS
jgi:hypothetical protein